MGWKRSTKILSKISILNTFVEKPNVTGLKNIYLLYQLPFIFINLFRDLLDEIKGFKYQITVKVLLRKNKQNGDIEFAPVYFNSTTKTVINFKYDLDKSSQDVCTELTVELMKDLVG